MKASTPASSRAAARADWREKNSSRVIGGTSSSGTWLLRWFQAHCSSELEDVQYFWNALAYDSLYRVNTFQSQHRAEQSIPALSASRKREQYPTKQQERQAEAPPPKSECYSSSTSSRCSSCISFPSWISDRHLLRRLVTEAAWYPFRHRGLTWLPIDALFSVKLTWCEYVLG